MKKIFFLLIFIFVLAACKTKKAAIDSNAIAVEMSSKKVAKKHVAANFNQKTVAAKLKAKFDNGKKLPSISVTLKMVKDEVIWLKASKFITLLKAKITPEKVSFYSPLEKKYFEGDFSSLQKIVGAAINFEQLQNLLLGQAVQNVKKEKQNLAIRENTYILSPVDQDILFDIFFAIHPAHFKLDQQSIVNTSKNMRLDVFYSDYKIIENEVFPGKISIKAKQKKAFTNLDLTFRNVEFNKELNTSFTIPNGYKRIKI